MFEKSKFKKKFPLLLTYILDKNVMKKLLNDNDFYDFYLKEKNNIQKIINIYNEIYEHDVNKKVNELINLDISKIIKVIENTNFCYNFSNAYKIPYNIEKFNIQTLSEIDKNELTLLIDILTYDYYVKEDYIINGINIRDMFVKLSLTGRNKILSIIRKNNLDFLIFVLKTVDNSEFTNLFLKKATTLEIDDRIYTKELMGELGEERYIKFINYYFNANLYDEDNEIVSKILDDKNYDLLMLPIFVERFSYRKIPKSRTDNEVFNILDRSQILDLFNSLFGYKIPRSYYSYLREIKSQITDSKTLEEFFIKYRQEIEFMESISYESVSSNEVSELRNTFEKLKQMTNKREMAISIKKMFDEMKNLFKQEYVNEFSLLNDKLSKSIQQEIDDSKNKKHKINILEFNGEPFSLLVTVMHEAARKDFQNMYNRPAHELTIKNPENFLKDLPNGSDLISCSMITDKYVELFCYNPNVIYAFSDLSSNDIVNISPEDGGYSPNISEEIDCFTHSEPMGVQRFMSETMNNRDYNEITIRRKNNEKKKLPTAIVCFDIINDESINHAEFFNIAIILINTNKYNFINGIKYLPKKR